MKKTVSYFTKVIESMRYFMSKNSAQGTVVKRARQNEHFMKNPSDVLLKKTAKPILTQVLNQRRDVVTSP